MTEASRAEIPDGRGMALRRGDRDVIGERARHTLAENIPVGIERFIAPPIWRSHEGIDDDLRAVVQCARAVISQNHREDNGVCLRGNAHQGEDVVPVQAGMGNLYSHPTLGHYGLGPLADSERGERIFDIPFGSVNGKH
jgi:hypothetical protein